MGVGLRAASQPTRERGRASSRALASRKRSCYTGDVVEAGRQRVFVCVISPRSRANYTLCRQHNLWGFTKRAQGLASLVRPNDLLWFYIGGKGFVALARAISPAEPFPADEPPPWRDGRKYSLRLRLDCVKDLSQPIKPAFPPGFGGYKFDPALGIGANHLLTGFFQLTPDQHSLLIEQSGGAEPNQPEVPTQPERGDGATVPPTGQQGTKKGTGPSTPGADEESGHTAAQLQLAQIGRALGLGVWIPKNDRNKWNQGQRLGSLAIAELPSLGLGKQAQAIVENIDVLWIKGEIVVCAFEVEHSTSIYSGILRLSDLVTVQPYTSIRLFIVASAERREKVARELSRPTFVRSDLPGKCRFISYDRLQGYLSLAQQLGKYLKLDWIEGLGEPLVGQAAAAP